MISTSESLNKFLESLAKLIGVIKKEEITFQKVESRAPLGDAFEAIGKLLDEASCALEKILEPKVIGILEPGKIYCLQVDLKSVNWEALEEQLRVWAYSGIYVAVIDQNVKFVSIPEGYKIVKE